MKYKELFNSLEKDSHLLWKQTIQSNLQDVKEWFLGADAAAFAPATIFDSSNLSLVCEIGYKTTDIFVMKLLAWVGMHISFGNGFELTCDKNIGKMFEFVCDEKIGQNRIILRIWWYF